jgi:hypothetical protein
MSSDISLPRSNSSSTPLHSLIMEVNDYGLCFLDLAIYQFDNRHRSSIARTISDAQNPCVTALSSGKPWGDLIEQLLDDSIAVDHLESLSTRMEVPALA